MPKPIPAYQASPPDVGDHYLDRARELGISFTEKTFVRAGVEWDYYVFRGSGDPPNDIGARGDLFQSAESDVWFRDKDIWKQAEPGEKDGRPKQKHPTLKAERCLRRSDLAWVCYSGYIPTSNKRTREDKDNAHYDPPVAGMSNMVGSTTKDKGHRTVYPGTNPQMMLSHAGQVGMHYAPPASVPLGLYPSNWYSPLPQVHGKNTHASLERAMDVNELRAHPARTSDGMLTDGIPQLGNPVNNWMIDIYRQILAPPTCMVPPLMENCKKLWQLLMKRPEILHEFSEDGIKYYGAPKTKGLKLSLDLVLLDMIRTNEGMIGVDYTTNASEENIPPSYVFASLLSLGQGEWGPVRRYWGASQIPATRYGVQSGQIDTDNFTKDGSVYLHGNWETAFVPAGAITQPHTDYSGSDQLKIHICGDKVWLTWPATDENLEWLSRNRPLFSCPPHDLVLRAVEELDGLRLHHFKWNEQQVFMLDPCCLHAVITLTNAAHTGVRCFKKEHFREAMRLVQYHIKIAINRYVYGLTSFTAMSFLDSVFNDLNLWKKTSFLDDDEKSTLEDVIKALFDAGRDLTAPASEARKAAKRRKKTDEI